MKGGKQFLFSAACAAAALAAAFACKHFAAPPNALMLSTAMFANLGQVSQPGRTPASGGREKPHLASPAPHSHAKLHEPALTSAPRLARAYGDLPLSFEPNRGQVSPRVRYVARGRGYALFLTDTEAVLSLAQAPARCGSPAPHAMRDSTAPARGAAPAATTDDVLRLQLAQANPRPGVSASGRLPGIVNYFLGDNPKAWHTHIPTYASVHFHDVYPGVDLIYHGRQGELEEDFVVAAGADPREIRMTLTGPQSKLGKRNSKSENRNAETGRRNSENGKRPMRVSADGDLIVETGGGEVRFRKPFLYQPSGESPASRTGGRARRHRIEGGFVLLAGNQVGFAVGPYDRRKPLVIDPTLTYSTYLGGANFSQANHIAADSSGDAYVVGFTGSSDFPVTSGAFQTSEASGSQVGFVTKLNAAGTALVYSTYLGGSNYGQANAITVDSSGDAYIAGQTFSSNFPTTAGAAQTTYGGAGDGFVAELNPTGSSLLYSSYLGGSANDEALGIALDPADGSGYFYVTGKTFSSNFPVLSALQGSLQGTENAFVAKFGPSGSLLYSTYLGGNGYDQGNGIGVDSAGNAYVAGSTTSTNFPLNLPIQSACASCPNGADAFVTEIDSNGSSLVYSTYLGGSSDDQALGIAVDGSGNAYVAGFTFSSNFPTTSGALQTTLQGTASAFVTEIAAGGASLAYSTYLGADHYAYGQAIALFSGDAYVTGTTSATGFPVVSAIQSTNGGDADAFVSELNATGSALVFSTYLGGSSFDQGSSIAVDGSGNIYLTGSTKSSDFPTANPYQSTFKGFNDAFVAKISVPTTASVSPTSLAFGDQAENTTSAAQAVTVTNTGGGNLNISSIAITGADPGDFGETNDCGSTLASGSSCTIDVTFTPTTAGARSANLAIYDNVAGSPQTVSLSGTGTGTAVSLSPTSLAFGNQVVGTSSTAQTVTLSNTGTTTVTISSIAITGTNSSDFSQTNNCGSSLAAGSNCTLNVTFTPAASGSRSASLTVTDSAPTSPQSAGLSGSGVIQLPAISLATKAYAASTNSGTSIATSSFSLPQGDLAVVYCGVGGSTTSVPTVSDSGGNSFQLIGTLLTDSNTETLAMFYASNAIAASSDRVTCTWATSYTNLAAMALVYSGVATTAPVDAQANGYVQGGTSLQTGSFSTSYSTEVIVAGMMSGSNCVQAPAAGSGYTMELDATPTGPHNCKNPLAAAEDELLSSQATNTTASMTLSANVNANMIAATFVAAGLNPAVYLAPSSLSFGSQATGTTSAPQTVTLSNTGGSTLTFSSIAITGTNNTDFAESDDCGTSLAAGANCTINVTFTPTATGTRTASLTITDNASGSPQTVSLTGTGATASTATLSPTSLTFASQTVGTTSAAQAVTLSNSAGTALSITSIAVTGTNSGDFAQTNNCGTSLAAGANCTINVTFTPTATGTRTAAVTVTDNASGSPQSASLTGTGAAAGTVSLSPSSLTFASQTVNTTSAAQTLTLSNSNTTAATISSIALSGTNSSDFAQTNNCGTSLAAGANCTINVTFTPTATGTRTAAVTVTDNASGSPQSASLTGTGAAAGTVSLSPSSLTFASQTVNTTSSAQALTLSNSNTTAVTISSIALSGTNSGDFAQTNNCGTSLAAGANCTINVTFTPTATGTRTASLTVTDSDPSSPQSASLTGTGASASGSGPTLVQVQNNIDTTTTAHTSFSVPITTTAGDFLVAFVRESSNGTDNFTVTDSAGQTWTLTSSGYENESSGGPRVGMFYMPSSAAVTSVTVNYTTSGGVIKPGIIVMEFSGMATSAVADGSVGAASGGDVTTSTSGGLSTSNANDLLIFATDTAGNESSWTAGTGYAIPNNNVAAGASGSNIRMAMQIAVVNSTQANATTTMSYGGTAWNGNLFAAFQAASGSSSAPVASLSPASLTFASQTVGTTSAAQTVTLSNTGNASLSISSVAITGANSGDFAQTNNCGASLAAGANCTINVTFTPTATGTRTAAVTVTDNATGSPQSASLTGTGAAAGTVSLSPASLTFASQTVNTTSAAQTLTLSNSNTTAVTISSIALSGTNSSDFAQTNNCGTSLAASSSCTINVTFTPTATGTRTAAVTVTDNATGSPQSASLTGTGAAAATATLSPTSLTFASQTVGTTSAAQAVTLSNSGGSALSISSIALTGTNSSDFAQTNNCGTSLAAGANCTINVTFTPTATGTRTASLTVTDTDPSSPQSASLTGTGAAAATATLSPTSLTFVSQTVGTTSAAQAVTLSNSGGSALSISSIALTGTNSGDFAQTNNCGTSLAANSNCTINVTFTPTATGTRTGAVTVTDNASGSPQSASLTGTGATASTATLSPTSLTFASQTVGTTSAAQAVTLSNSGGSALSISSIAITGTNSGDFAQTNNCGTSLAAGTNCTINVTFTPTATGTRTGAVTVTDNASGSPQSASLTGTGAAAGTVSLSPASLTFASQTVNTTSAAQTLTLSNSNTTAVTISSIALTGTNSSDFAQTNNCGTSLAANSSCTINVTFTPTATGTRTAAVTVTDNATGSPQSASLTGTGSSASGSGPTLVQVQNNIDTTTTAHTSFSVPITTTAGDFLVAFVRESSNGTDNFTVTDSAGQTWQLTSSGYENESGSGPRGGMFYIPNSAAVTSVTVNYTTSGGVIKPGIMVMEFSGMATSAVADGSVGAASGAGATTSTSGSLSTSNANDLLIFATDTAGNESSWTAGTGYAIPNNNVAAGANGSNIRMAMQFAVVSSTQSNATTTMTYGSSNWNGNIFAAFKQ